MKDCLWTLLAVLLLVIGTSGCVQSSDDHEHGPGTHTHDDEEVADTAGTYADTTGAEAVPADYHE